MKAKKSPLLLDQQLCFALYTASRFMTQAYEPLLSELGLTYAQYLVMLVLWEKDEVSVNEIGKFLKLDSGTLSPLLKKLEAKELILRTRQKEDERVVLIELTNHGRELRKKAAKVPLAMICKLQMNEKELIEMRDELNELIGKLSKNP